MKIHTIEEWKLAFSRYKTREKTVRDKLIHLKHRKNPVLLTPDEIDYLLDLIG